MVEEVKDVDMGRWNQADKTTCHGIGMSETEDKFYDDTGIGIARQSIPYSI